MALYAECLIKMVENMS